MELIDEMKAHLPIPAYANRDLSRLLIENGLEVTPERELKIINLAESGQDICLLKKKRIRSIFRSKGLRPKMRP